MEKFKNYDKMVETVKTLSEENKYLERRATEAERSLEETKRRNVELSQKVADKEELMKKKYEQKQLLQKNIELETDLGSKIAECTQLTADVNELQQLNQKQEESIKQLHKKLQESQLKSDRKKAAYSPSRRNLSSDFNEIVNQLERQDLYRKTQKHKSESFPHHFGENGNAATIEEEDSPKQGEGQMSGRKEKGDMGEDRDQLQQEEYNEEKNGSDQDKMELLELENEKLRVQIKKMQQDYAKKSSVSDQLKQINALSEENAAYQSQIAILQKKCQSTSAEIEEEKSKTIKNHQEIIKSLKERLALLQEECKELKEGQQTSELADSLRQELMRYKKQLEFVRADSEDKKKQLEDEIKLLVCLLTEMKMKSINLKRDQSGENVQKQTSNMTAALPQQYQKR